MPATTSTSSARRKTGPRIDGDDVLIGGAEEIVSSLVPLLRASEPELTKGPRGPPAKTTTTDVRRLPSRLARLMNIVFLEPPASSRSRTSKRWPMDMSAHRRSIWMSYILLVAVSLIAEVFIYRAGLAAARLYPALGDRAASMFTLTLVECLLCYTIVSLLRAVAQVLGALMTLRMRARLTSVLHSKYLSSPTTLYKVSTTALNRGAADDTMAEDDTLSTPRSLSLDNPDQTVVADVDKLGDCMRKILRDAVIDPLLMIFYTFRLIVISGGGTSHDGVWTHYNFVPAILVYVFFFGTGLIVRAVGARIVPLVYTREAREGDLRSSHIFTLNNAETIALLRGTAAACISLDSRLLSTLLAQWSAAIAAAWLRLATELVSYVGALISYAVVAIPVFDGSLDDKTPAQIIEAVSANLFIVIYLVHTFTSISNLSETFSEAAGYVTRIGLLLDVLDTATNASPLSEPPGPTSVVFETANGLRREQEVIVMDATTPLLTITDLTYSPPLAPSLTLPASHQPINLIIRPNEHTLIQGPSGSGKSSLLRVLSGLWPPSSHSLVTFADRVDPALIDDVMFVPQTPLIDPTTTVLLNLAYPSTVPVDFYLAREVLRIVSLEHLLNSDMHDDENEEEDGDNDARPETRATMLAGLSGGERQRLAFARVLCRVPRMVFLDEVMAGVDAALETRMWDALFERTRGRTTVVVICHGGVAVNDPRFVQRVVVE